MVLLGAEWWGTLTASCEVARGRRSCLLLSVMRPGAAAAPWLGALDQLGPAEEGATPGNLLLLPVAQARTSIVTPSYRQLFDSNLYEILNSATTVRKRN